MNDNDYGSFGTVPMIIDACSNLGLNLNVKNIRESLTF